jgi:hypothetical protein
MELGTSQLVVSPTGNMKMTTVTEYLKFAAECEQLARAIPAHAESLQKIAEAWRSLAKEAEQKAPSVKHDGTMRT